MITQVEKQNLIREFDEAKILSAKELGKKVRAVRKKNTDYNQEEVSELIGTVQSAMSEIETGKYSPITLDLIGRISVVLKANPHELAAAYWGVSPGEFSNQDREFLDSILILVENYKTSKIQSTSPIPPRRHQETEKNLQGIEAGMKVHRARSAAKKKASQKEKLPPPNPETGK
jgi:DNA-binding XRE family transcriptional regulator